MYLFPSAWYLRKVILKWVFSKKKKVWISHVSSWRCLSFLDISRGQNATKITKSHSQGILFAIISCQRVWGRSGRGPLTPPALASLEKSKGTPEKARIFLFAEPLKSLGKEKEKNRPPKKQGESESKKNKEIEKSKHWRVRVNAEIFPQRSAKFPQLSAESPHPFLAQSNVFFANFRELSAEFPRTFRKKKLFANDPIHELLTFANPRLLNFSTFLLGARLRGRTATQRSKKGSEKVLGRVLGEGSQKGSEKGACCGFYRKNLFWEGF